MKSEFFTYFYMPKIVGDCTHTMVPVILIGLQKLKMYSY